MGVFVTQNIVKIYRSFLKILVTNRIKSVKQFDENGSLVVKLFYRTNEIIINVLECFIFNFKGATGEMACKIKCSIYNILCPCLPILVNFLKINCSVTRQIIGFNV